MHGSLGRVSALPSLLLSDAHRSSRRPLRRQEAGPDECTIITVEVSPEREHGDAVLGRADLRAVRAEAGVVVGGSLTVVRPVRWQVLPR